VERHRLRTFDPNVSAAESKLLFEYHGIAIPLKRMSRLANDEVDAGTDCANFSE
jgi:hypothetical protein